MTNQNLAWVASDHFPFIVDHSFYVEMNYNPFWVGVDQFPLVFNWHLAELKQNLLWAAKDESPSILK